MPQWALSFFMAFGVCHGSRPQHSPRNEIVQPELWLLSTMTISLTDPSRITLHTTRQHRPAH
jgi:hypothetical protein